MKLVKILILLILLFNSTISLADKNFNQWLNSFKIHAMNNGISNTTIEKVLQNAQFLPKVIEYDRYQPEFYEDTKTYILKRTSKKKIDLGIGLFNSNQNLINEVEHKYNVEKELLLALMGIETNFGSYLGKMDIISSLATLSYDKRRSAFFTNELITLLKLVDKNVINYKILYGSWAGAFGNFQFMPTTIEKYAIDYDKDKNIDLKSLNDSFASAANYLNLLGWKKNQPCYLSIELNENVPLKFLNTSAKKLKNKQKVKKLKMFIKNYEKINIDENLTSAIITPDKDIVDNANHLKPAFLVFDNYELILKWNRSLRFALAVCTLKDFFKNEF